MNLLTCPLATHTHTHTHALAHINNVYVLMLLMMMRFAFVHMTGDRLLEVDGANLRGVSHHQAVECLKRTGEVCTYAITHMHMATNICKHAHAIQHIYMKNIFC